MTPVVQLKVQVKVPFTSSQLEDPSSDVLMLGQTAESGFLMQFSSSLKFPPGRHVLKGGPGSYQGLSRYFESCGDCESKNVQKYMVIFIGNLSD